MLVFMTSKSDFRCLDIKDHRNHRRKAVVMNGSSINNPSTQDIEEGKKKRYWDRRIANTRAQQSQIPIEILFLKKERGKKRKGEVREGGRQKTERIEDIHRAHLWAVPLVPSTSTNHGGTFSWQEPLAFWQLSLSGACRIRVTTGGKESCSTYYMRKANMWTRIRGFNFSTTADGPQIPEVICNFKVHLTKLVFDSFIHQQQPLKFQNPIMSISDQYI